MNRGRLVQYGLIPLLVLWLTLAGCAKNGTFSDSEQQGPGNGNIAKHNRQSRGERPPENENKITIQPVVSAEAFAACVEKKPGENVEFSLSNGRIIEAKCTVINDHLVAVPSRNSMQHPRGKR